MRLAQEAARFQGLELPYDLDRKLRLLRLALTVPAPNNAEATRELALIETSMESAYGRGKYCPDQDTCWDLQVMSKMLVESQDENHLREVWKGWRTIAPPPMREEFTRYVELGNKGARELGFTDLGSMWRSQYDMPPDAFAAELDRLWEQVKPLYVSLHAYVRHRLRETYGPEIMPASGPIPAHLLGNMWAQQWGNIYPLVAPEDSDPGYDLTEKLQSKGTDAPEMVRYGERFFLSLGFEPLPETFWERSLFVKPRDRDVVCHASAWSIDAADDLRIKMCIDITAEDFSTIHHELGHNFYQRAYMNQPPLYRGSANDGFHEAIGDTLALSVTPAYLKELGLIDEEPDTSKDIGLLLRMALDKVAFLPFGLLVDQWRWRVFSGEVARALQRSLVEATGELPGRGRTGCAIRSRLRSGRQIPRAREHSLLPLLRCSHSSIPVPPRPLQGGRLRRTAQPLHDLRQQSGRGTLERDARDGVVATLARGARNDDRGDRDGRHRHSRFFRASAGLAR